MKKEHKKPLKKKAVENTNFGHEERTLETLEEKAVENSKITS